MNEPDVFDLIIKAVRYTRYTDGTVVPQLEVVATKNGAPIGEANVHLHKRVGRDKIADVSWGFTGIAYGPFAERTAED